MSTYGAREHYLSGKKVVVAGAGVAGLAFAIALRKLWPRSIEPPVVVIYDRDPKEPSQLGLLDDHVQDQGRGTGHFTMWTHKFKPMIGVRAKASADISTASIRIAQKDLRRVLQLDDGRLQIRLVDEESAETDEECDILIAADGASSKIRTCLRLDDNLKFTGLHSLVWALSILEAAPRPKHDNCDPQQAQEVLSQARELGKDIMEPFENHPRRDRPQPFSHDMKVGPVIFIGDSNHAVSLFARNGANLALKDGWDLAEHLCQFTDLDRAMTTYDKRSLPRAIATLKNFHWRIKVGHATGLQYWMYRTFFTILGAIIRLLG
ncbi:putative monooxygenase [Xylaria cf. heliscus]|nr:putative monooxygenase [Xylaria cf. heliscus]